ncbi:zinc transport system substrate-binding protein [Pelagirhabdus alkalitolerans]|uniref:Zinc transport system substrate-binding protein n=1 Tax=Pelagirhabdus alkalitolerans TaxID=1612202 RepID=A0A1G6K086_9BACI|nr:zinc ABC transporter substrate-binding protein [Pelagirhabdus alkalitolerans]SDC24400.1 zinc transport system substrate-binding protein [Pelagirhabdus alkalitolerans]
MTKQKIVIAMLAMFVSGILLSACNQEDIGETDAGDDAEIDVVTSFYPMYEFTQQIAGERANVSLMVSGGDDAHHYEPSAQDVAEVNDADVFVYSSEEMEFWAESLLDTVENDDLIVARAADGMDVFDSDHYDEEDEHDHEYESEDSVIISGENHHYHTGEMIELTADLESDVEYDDWHWYTRDDSDSEWEMVSGQGSNTFSYEAGNHDFEVKAALYDDDHDVYAESEPFEIDIDNHDDDHDHDDDGHDREDEDDHSHEDNGHDHESDTIELSGLSEHYHSGDVVSLEAILHSDVEYDDWHWYKRYDHNDEWEMISGQDSHYFDYETSRESFEVKAVLYDDDHEAYAESEAVQVEIDDHDDTDPHIWLDPIYAQEQVNTIRDALIEADPDGEDIYTENAEEFNTELQELHEEYEAAFEGAENRTFVVQHQAFGYIENRYDLEQISIGGLSTEVEPSPSRIAEIGDLVEETGAPVIYYQSGANSDIAQTVATETGTETAVLHDLESLPEELAEGDLGYIDVMRDNLEALQLSIQ